MAGLLDDPTQQQAQPQYSVLGTGAADHGGSSMLDYFRAMNGAAFPTPQQTGPAPLTPQQLAIQQAAAGTPLPQGFNPAMLGGNMAAMPHPQGFNPAMMGGGGAGLPNPAAFGAAQTGLGLLQNSQPQPAPAAPSMLGGGGAVPQARMGPGGVAAPSGGMGGGMLNPQMLKMLTGAGNGTA